MCKTEDNSIEHVFNKCLVTKEDREIFIKECNEYEYYPRDALTACNELYYSYIPHLEVIYSNLGEKIPRKKKLIRAMKKYVRKVYIMLWNFDTSKKKDETDLLGI